MSREIGTGASRVPSGSDPSRSRRASQVAADSQGAITRISSGSRTFSNQMSLGWGAGPLGLTQTDEPADPKAGEAVLWMSNGTGYGDEGDVIVKTNVDGTITNVIFGSHEDTSSQADSTNSGRTYIQDVVLDDYGHVTGLEVATETVTDTNTNQLTVWQVRDGSDTFDVANGDDVLFAVTGAASVDVTSAGTVRTVTIGATDTDTTYAVFTAAAATGDSGTTGLVPKPADGEHVEFLRGDKTWAVPTDTNTNQLTVWQVRDGSDTFDVANGDDVLFAVTGAASVDVTSAGTVRTVTIGATDTTYVAATSSVLGLMKLEDDTEQAVAAEAVSATTGRTYGVQFNSSDQAVVNVPWADTDTNTTYDLLCPSGTTAIRLDPSTGANDDITITAGNGVTVVRDSDTEMTIGAYTYGISCQDGLGGSTTQERIILTGTREGGGSLDDITLEAGTGLSIARDGDKITFTNEGGSGIANGDTLSSGRYDD